MNHVINKTGKTFLLQYIKTDAWLENGLILYKNCISQSLLFRSWTSFLLNLSIVYCLMFLEGNRIIWFMDIPTWSVYWIHFKRKQDWSSEFPFLHKITFCNKLFYDGSVKSNSALRFSTEIHIIRITMINQSNP